MIVMTSIVRPNGRCQILSSDLLEMQPHPDRDTEIIQNTERVLDIAADFIRQAPRQWAIFQPVWPESMAEVPK
jgi:lauroyl/myristoyl acyltransferase